MSIKKQRLKEKEPFPWERLFFRLRVLVLEKIADLGQQFFGVFGNGDLCLVGCKAGGLLLGGGTCGGLGFCLGGFRCGGLCGEVIK